jgi:hypothetical protein
VDRHARPRETRQEKNKTTEIVEIVVEMCCVTIMETQVLFFFYGGLPDALNSRRQVFSFF